MAINLLYFNEMEANAISFILEMDGYQINRLNLNFKSIDPFQFQSIFIIDTEYLQRSRKKQLDKLYSSKNSIALVGNLSDLHWFFKINCNLSCFISKKEKIDALNFGIKKLIAKKPFYSKKVLSFLKKERPKQHEILLQQSLSCHLTITELETMFQIATGKTTKQIAKGWNRSHHTINNHRKIF